MGRILASLAMGRHPLARSDSQSASPPPVSSCCTLGCWLGLEGHQWVIRRSSVGHHVWLLTHQCLMALYCPLLVDSSRHACALTFLQIVLVQRWEEHGNELREGNFVRFVEVERFPGEPKPPVRHREGEHLEGIGWGDAPHWW